MPHYTSSGASSWSNYSGNPFIDALLVGTQWGLGQGSGTTTITVSFPWVDGAASFFAYSNEPNSTATAGFDAAQRLQIMDAFSAWSNVANLQFIGVQEDSLGNVGDIRVAMSDAVGDWWGWANYPGGHPAAGDIWIHTRYAAESFHPGTYNFYATLHEIGHALGLDHTFDGYVIPAGFDDRRYSVMSYTDPAGAYWYDNAAASWVYLISGPMVYDILAIQHLYGANMDYEAGNSVYAFQEDRPFITALWDAGGIDLIDLSDFTNGCSVNLEPGSYSTTNFVNHNITNNLGIAFGAVIENVLAGSGNDFLWGNSAANFFRGGAGADTLHGVDGNDRLEGGDGDDLLDGGSGANRLNGGAGNDTLINGMVLYDTALAGVRIDLAAGSAVSLATNDAAGIGTDVLTNITAACGSNFADLMIASATGCSLYGLAGDDTLNGGAGNDFFDGGLGNDSQAGFAGNDTFVGGAGDDWINGSGGVDLISFTDAAAGVLVDLQAQLARSLAANLAGIGVDEVISLESVDGSAFGDELRGNGGDNALSGLGGNDMLRGNAGSDTLAGGAGLDKMYGGTGDDSYIVADTTDYVYENVGEGTDTVLSSISLTLRPNVENLTLTGVANVFGKGNDLDNAVTGNNGANKLFGMDGNDVLLGGAGNDRLDGGNGADQLSGGTGNDLYYVNDTLDTVSELVGQGSDRLYASISYVLGANIEYLTLTGTAGLDATGNNLGNFLYGNAGANTMLGLNGDDRIYGWAGNDTLDGGVGVDRMWGGTGDDFYYVHDATDYTYEYAGEGIDTVYSDVSQILRAHVENLILTGSADHYGRGNGEANAITGNSGANKLFGLTGSDMLDGGAGDDLIEGGADRDVTSGGAGADLFAFNNGDFAGMGEGSADRILDFSQADGDRIRLSAVDANTTLGGDQAFAFIGGNAFGNVAGQLRYEAIGGNTYVMGDTNGDGAADFWIRLDGTHTLGSGDFIL